MAKKTRRKKRKPKDPLPGLAKILAERWGDSYNKLVSEYWEKTKYKKMWD